MVNKEQFLVKLLNILVRETNSDVKYLNKFAGIIKDVLDNKKVLLGELECDVYGCRHTLDRLIELIEKDLNEYILLNKTYTTYEDWSQIDVKVIILCVNNNYMYIRIKRWSLYCYTKIDDIVINIVRDLRMFNIDPSEIFDIKSICNFINKIETFKKV